MKKIAVIGLGYVGLPLAVCLAKNAEHAVVGFDINANRVKELQKGSDYTGEVNEAVLHQARVTFTDDIEYLKGKDLFIVTVPTPVDEHNVPDIEPLRKASVMISKWLQKGAIVVYESTVYPGLTEEICVPILEAGSGLTWLKDFNVGYSPERINPGDKTHTIDKITKVVAGDTTETTELLAVVYGSVISAGVYKAASIKVAEAAKVIENTQRDLNIALMNELAIVFNKMGLSTQAVLAAASTKWNFLGFKPGLVGGHCIGVDPYYLTFKAQTVGYLPEVILAGRRINDNMGTYIVDQTLKQMIEADKKIKGSKVLICGLSFKENVSDIRNTRVIDIYNELLAYKVQPYVYDPIVCEQEASNIYGIQLLKTIEEQGPYSAIILAVKHAEFLNKLTAETLEQLMEPGSVVIDVPGIFFNHEKSFQHCRYWSL
jgi:UDP-N-acetyl-D-galactosamine dehydrogenase